MSVLSELLKELRTVLPHWIHKVVMSIFFLLTLLQHSWFFGSTPIEITKEVL